MQCLTHHKETIGHQADFHDCKLSTQRQSIAGVINSLSQVFLNMCVVVYCTGTRPNEMSYSWQQYMLLLWLHRPLTFSVCVWSKKWNDWKQCLTLHRETICHQADFHDCKLCTQRQSIAGVIKSLSQVSLNTCVVTKASLSKRKQFHIGVTFMTENSPHEDSLSLVWLFWCVLPKYVCGQRTGLTSRIVLLSTEKQPVTGVTFTIALSPLKDTLSLVRLF